MKRFFVASLIVLIITRGLFPSVSFAEGQINSWGIESVRANLSHKQHFTGKGVKVAVIDSGIDINHEDIDIEPEKMKNFVENEEDELPIDNLGHGTHVDGIIAAKDNDKGVVGIAPDVDLYILKVLRDNDNWQYKDLYEALSWCEEQDIDIINLSLALDIKDTLLFTYKIDKKLKDLRNKGVLIVVSAGNGVA